MNAAKVDVEVYASATAACCRPCARRISWASSRRHRADHRRRRRAQRSGRASLDTAKAELNQDVVTAFPVLQAVGKLEPGLYVMMAQASGRRRRRPPTRKAATRPRPRNGSWSPISGSPPSRAATASTSSPARSPAPSRARRRDPARRPQQRGPGHRPDRRARATPPSIPASRAARAASRRASSWRRSGGDYGFLDLGQSRLRPHRPRREGPRRRRARSRPSSTPSAASTARARP